MMTDFFSMSYIKRKSVECESTGCWLWKGQKDKDGYGQFRTASKGKWHKAHRVSFEVSIGPIPPTLEVAHTCHNKSCVNPRHLVTCRHVENVHMTLSKAGGVWERALQASALAIKHDKKGLSIFEISKKLNVNRKLVSQMVNGSR